MADIRSAEYHEHAAEAVVDASVRGYVSAGDVAMAQLHATLAVAARLRDLPILIRSAGIGHFIESDPTIGSD